MKTLDDLKIDLKKSNIEIIEKRILWALRCEEQEVAISKDYFTDGVRSAVVRSGYVISNEDDGFIFIDLTKTDYSF